MGNTLDVILNFLKKGTGDKESISTLKTLNNAFKQLTGIGLGTATALGAVGLGLREVTKFTKESVTETVAYNKTIRESMQLTGLSADETSRLIQVSDDWGISIDNANSALELMNKKGITPSIDNLAKIADEYVNATDKSKFMEEASKSYGKSFGNLIPILAQGGKALREQTSAIDDNLIATEESMGASRKYEVAMDELNDTVQGLKYSLGDGLLPVLIDVLNAMNSVVIASKQDIDVRRISQKLVEAGIMTDNERLDLLWKILIGEKDQNEAVKELNTSYYNNIGYEERLNEARGDRTIGLAAETKATNTATDSITAYGREIDGITRIKVVEALDAQAKAAEKVTQGFDDLSLAIGGRLGPELDDFNQKQDDIKTKMGEVQGEIDKAISQGYYPLGEKVLDLQGKYDDLAGEYDANATEHEEATKRILFDLAQQQLAMSGLDPSAQLGVLQELADRFGIIDTATQQANVAFETLVGATNVENAEELDEAMSYINDSLIDGRISAEEMKMALDILNGTKVYVQIETQHIDNWTRQGNSQQQYDQYGNPISGQRAAGGPVSGGGAYMVGEMGPEMFIPNQNGTIIPNRGSGTTNNNNTWNVFTNAGITPYSRSYHIAKAMAG